MLELMRIADLLDRAGHGDAWHGPPVDSTLAGITAEQASARPVAGGHSIWEIALHIAVWDRVVTRRLTGQSFEPSAAQDWPAVTDTSDRAWRSAVGDLRQARSELRSALLAFDPIVSTTRCPARRIRSMSWPMGSCSTISITPARSRCSGRQLNDLDALCADGAALRYARQH